jgi:hypothetical protein
MNLGHNLSKKPAALLQSLLRGANNVPLAMIALKIRDVDMSTQKIDTTTLDSKSDWEALEQTRVGLFSDEPLQHAMLPLKIVKYASVTNNSREASSGWLRYGFRFGSCIRRNTLWRETMKKIWLWDGRQTGSGKMLLRKVRLHSTPGLDGIRQSY